ncbi:MAG TPA: 4Fe-4S binding protein [Bacteroidales bacterium]|nr:4Fe-4S binding protein [Bacteroidales bacterium]HRS19703.1 4Fe-4S binding protein [Bacteroidales bacterium]
MNNIKKHILSPEFITALLVGFLLTIVQYKVARPMLMAERFVQGAGWIQIVAAMIYAAWVMHYIKQPHLSATWRLRIWMTFSIVFFSQLLIGLLGAEQFLMTGKLHFPIPALIIAGPLYRGEITFMIILFISTIVLTGPAWCSYLCYFGAIDGWASRGKTPHTPIAHTWRYKITGLLLVIGVTIVLRICTVPILYAIILASLFGIGGLAVIVFISKKRKKMVHCITYCPIGTIVSFAKYVSPFRMRIAPDCNACMKCSMTCKYDALQKIEIQHLRPGLTCTYCGDCIPSCKSQSIHYTVFGSGTNKARIIFLVLTISLHTCCLMLARI